MKVIQYNRKSLAYFISTNPILKLGEIAHDTTTEKFKIGDGISRYNDLPYLEYDSSISIAEDGTIIKDVSKYDNRIILKILGGKDE